jgi:DNA-binding MarR family transcriptional regulator
MTERSLAPHTQKLVAIWSAIMRLAPRLHSVVPTDLARVKARLIKLHPEGGAKRASDFNLFYRIGVVLTHNDAPMTMSDLSAALAVPLSTATRTMDWMVEAGYIERVLDPNDRRLVRVALTKTGKQLYQTINEYIQRHAEELLRDFSAQEREQLITLLQKLVHSLERITD